MVVVVPAVLLGDADELAPPSPEEPLDVEAVDDAGFPSCSLPQAPSRPAVHSPKHQDPNAIFIAIHFC